MRFAALYLRSRRVPAALAVVTVSVVALWLIGVVVDDPQFSLALAVLAAAIGVAAFGPGLAGADVELDRTAAIAWPSWRAAHVLAASAVVAAVLAVTLLSPQGVGIAMIARNAAGLGGLAALGAVALGASRAWILPVGWAIAAVVAGAPLTGAWYREALTWLTQPAGTTSATVTATVLAAAGTLAYAAWGPRR